MGKAKLLSPIHKNFFNILRLIIKMSLTIGIDASTANKKQKTGVEWYSYHLIRELAKIDQTNTYRLYTPEPLESGLLNLGNNFSEQILKWPFKYMWLQGRLSLEMQKNPPDVLLVPAQPLPIICPKKSINTIHDLGFIKYPKVYSRKQLKYLKWSVGHAARKAKKIITISNFTKSELIKLYGIKEEQIKVTYLGYDQTIFRSIEDKNILERVKEKYSLADNFLLFVGRIESKKDVATLVQAFELVENEKLELVLVGQPGFGYEKINQLIKKSPKKKLIKQVGWVEEGIVPLLMNACQAFIFPSLYEGFGLPIVQAMACGTPIVASDIPTLKEIGQDACLYFETRSEEDLARKIDQIMHDKELSDNLVEKGLDLCQQFTWQKCAEQTLRLINVLK